MDQHQRFQHKKELRQKMRDTRDALDKEWKRSYDVRMNERLVQLITDRNANSIHLYLPIGSEINIRPAIDVWLRDGKHLICPKALPARKLSHHTLSSRQELEKGYFGTRHPIGPALDSGEADIILVPGLAFDTLNRRLGYGSGYYDTFLQTLKTGHSVGLAYPFQFMDEIPVDEWDMPLNEIIVLKA